MIRYHMIGVSWWEFSIIIFTEHLGAIALLCEIIRYNVTGITSFMLISMFVTCLPIEAYWQMIFSLSLCLTAQNTMFLRIRSFCISYYTPYRWTAQSKLSKIFEIQVRSNLILWSSRLVLLYVGCSCSMGIHQNYFERLYSKFFS